MSIAQPIAERFTLHLGDAREVLKSLPDASVDSIVCDPPYGLGKDPDMGAVLSCWLAGADYAATGGGFMGLAWDSFVPGPPVWRECLRVLKPGGHLLAFFGSRTYDMGTLAIRLAGFEIRDQIMWVYGSGFPKSMDVSKAIDKAAGAEREVVGRKTGRMANPVGDIRGEVLVGEKGRIDCSAITAPATDAAREWEGWGTALKPAHEPICVARKPLIGTVAQNVLEHGTGALNIDACRIPTDEVLRAGAGGIPCRHTPGERPRGREGESSADRRYAEVGGTDFAMKPGPRGGDPAGRWPANFIHDGSAPVLAAFPAEAGANSPVHRRGSDKFRATYGEFKGNVDETGSTFQGDSGSAARFFYCPKASRKDRNEGCDELPDSTGGMVSNTSGQHITRRDGWQQAPVKNDHPTVKPTDLMAYLCRLVTPPGGTVLDWCVGSGSTGKGAIREGFNFIGIDLGPENIAIARARCAHEVRRADARRAAQAAASAEATQQGNLFEEAA